MVFTKKATKTPAVMVETKKLSAKDTCGIGCCKMGHLLVPVLLVINFLLLVWILANQTMVEASKVGGRDNYKMVQQIYTSDAFKAQQRQQIEQALQMYQQGADLTAPTADTQVQVQPQVQPMVTE